MVLLLRQVLLLVTEASCDCQLLSVDGFLIQLLLVVNWRLGRGCHLIGQTDGVERLIGWRQGDATLRGRHHCTIAGGGALSQLDRRRCVIPIGRASISASLMHTVLGRLVIVVLLLHLLLLFGAI